MLCLSSFGCEELKLPKQHIVHCTTLDKAWVGNIHQKGDKTIFYASHSCSHFWDTTNGVIYQDLLALDLTCLGGYLGGAESEPGAGKLPIWPTLQPQDNQVETLRCLMYKLGGTFSDCNHKIFNEVIQAKAFPKTPPQNHRDISGPTPKHLEKKMWKFKLTALMLSFFPFGQLTTQVE